MPPHGAVSRGRVVAVEDEEGKQVAAEKPPVAEAEVDDPDEDDATA